MSALNMQRFSYGGSRVTMRPCWRQGDVSFCYELLTYKWNRRLREAFGEELGVSRILGFLTMGFQAGLSFSFSASPHFEWICC